MGRAADRMREKAIKKLAKSNKIPPEKREEVIEAFKKVDFNFLMNNPEAMADVFNNPTNLGKYVVDDEVSTDVSANNA